MSGLKGVHDAIRLLARLRRGNEESVQNYLKVLNSTIEAAKDCLRDPNYDKLVDSYETNITLRFVYASLYVLRKLATSSNNDSLDNLISIQQQRTIKVLLQLLFSLGILPSLLPGVNIPLAKKTMHLSLHFQEKWSMIEHHNFLTYAVRELLDLLKSPNLRSLILFHLGDLLSALLQMIHCGKIRKPIKEPVDQASAEGFTMTEEWYKRLTSERCEFIEAYKELVEGIYKPLVIKELLLLLMPCRGKEITNPRWLEKAITTQLTGYLVSPGGVAMTMRACCPSSTETVEWAKVVTMANLISTVHGNMDPDTFYSLISPQIISLLNTTGTYCLPVAKMCIKLFLKQDPERCNKYIFDKLFEPFILCSKPVGDKFTGTLISEESLGRCIDHINKCFTLGSQESALPIEALIKIIKIKFALYLKVFGSPFQHQLAVQDLLIRFLHAETDIDRLIKIYNALLFDESHPEMLEMSKELTFEFGPSGGVQVMKGTEIPKPGPPLDAVLGIHYKPGLDTGLRHHCKAGHACESMLDLLSQNEMYSSKLLYHLFVVLLTSLLTLFHDENGEALDIKPDLLDASEIFFHILGKKEKKLFTIKLLADLSENSWVVESIQKQPELIIKLIIVLLQRCALALKDNSNRYRGEDEEDDMTDLAIPLRIVDIMTGDMKPGAEGWAALEPLLEPLKTLQGSFPVDYVRAMCGIIYERLLTQGAVKNTMPPKSANRRKAKVQETPVKSKAKTAGESSKKNKHVCHTKDGLSAIMELVYDEDIPTRGHGLIQLEKKIRKRDAEVIARKEEIFILLKHSLADQDSYVYLSAIAALEAMGFINAGMVIEFLCEEYMVSKKDTSDLQLKIGEVLVRITRTLSDLGPTNKNRMINTFLFGAKSSDEFLRASSLSNLGEVLQYFGYSCSIVLQEVFVCSRSIAYSDKSAMVRRAAVLLAHLLIKGYSGAALLSLQTVLLDLYRMLKHVYQTDKDEVVRLHAEAALLEVNAHIENDVTKPRPLEKMISVLNFDH